MLDSPPPIACYLSMRHLVHPVNIYHLSLLESLETNPMQFV